MGSKVTALLQFVVEIPVDVFVAERLAVIGQFESNPRRIAFAESLPFASYAIARLKLPSFTIRDAVVNYIYVRIDPERRNRAPNIHAFI